MRKIICIVVLASLFGGCATQQPQMSREEWQKIRNRKYDVSQERVLSAAENVFKMADPSDVRFTYSDNSLKAVRWAAPFPINIWYHWDIVTKKNDSGTDVTVSITSTSAGLGVPGGMFPADSSDAIKLFYSRLDYLLGKSVEWKSCDDYELANPGATTLEALCLCADDLPPSKKTAAAATAF